MDRTDNQQRHQTPVRVGLLQMHGAFTETVGEFIFVPAFWMSDSSRKKKYCSFEPDVIQRYFVMLASTSDHTDAINWMAVLNQIWYRDVLSCLLVRLILLMRLIAQVSIDSISVKTLVQPCAVTHECTQSHRWRFFFFFLVPYCPLWKFQVVLPL